MLPGGAHAWGLAGGLVSAWGGAAGRSDPAAHRVRPDQRYGRSTVCSNCCRCRPHSRHIQYKDRLAIRIYISLRGGRRCPIHATVLNTNMIRCRKHADMEGTAATAAHEQTRLHPRCPFTGRSTSKNGPTKSFLRMYHRACRLVHRTAPRGRSVSGRGRGAAAPARVASTHRLSDRRNT